MAFVYSGCSQDEPVPLDTSRQTAAEANVVSESVVLNSDAFFFLPPLLPKPVYTGTFDGTLSPQVRVCELEGTVCGVEIASFSGTDIKVDLIEEAYMATWNTKDAGLDPEKSYRIEVRLGTILLGYIDLVVLNSGNEKKEVAPSQFATVVKGATLPIRFRIENGSIPPPAGPWQEGEVITHIQSIWGSPGEGANLVLTTYYNFVYESAFGVLEVGIPGAAGFSIVFTSGLSVTAYLPALGSLGALNADLLDPTNSASGSFGGEVTALSLNVDFSDAGHTLGTSGIAFGDLTLCGFTTTLAGLNGLTVRDFLALANSALGGGVTTLTITEFHLITEELNASFGGGGVSQFAQDHLVNGACP